jgi:hypothetical protein
MIIGICVERYIPMICVLSAVGKAHGCGRGIAIVSPCLKRGCVCGARRGWDFGEANQAALAVEPSRTLLIGREYTLSQS